MNVNVNIPGQTVQVEIDSGVVASGPQGPQGPAGPPAGVNFGLWDAAANTPTITNGVGNEGDFYTVSVAGATVINGAGPWSRGDQILFKGGAWTRVAAQVEASGFNKGGWNAAINSPAITSGVGALGDFYTVTTAGGTVIDGAGPWNLGDQILFKGGAWVRIPLASASGGTNKGEWNALANVPALASSVGTEGDFYTVSMAGTTTLNGVSTWAVADQVLFKGGAWIRVKAQLLAIDGSNIPPSTVTTTSGALVLRQAQNVFFFTPEDYGARGDGVTDDTAAIKRAILARRAAGGVLKFGRKKYVFKEPLVDYGAYMAWQGENSVLVWDGLTTGDMITFGQAGFELLFPLVEGLMIKTKKVMTSGWMMVAHAPARGVFRDIVIQGIDGAGEFGGRPYNGLFFNGYSYVSVQRIETGATAGAQTAIGIRGIPLGAQAGLFFEGGNRISGFDVGIRNGGGNGGVYFDQTDVIGNVTANVLHDNSYEAQHNREIFWSSTCSIDSGSSLGCYVIDQNGGGPSLVVFDKTWICSAQGTLSAPGGVPGFGAGLYLKRGPDVRMIGSLYLHNNGGDAFRCDEPECDVLIEGLCMNNKGWGINRTTADQRVQVAGMIFVQNLLGDQNPAFAPATTFVDHDRIRARNIRVQNGGQVTLDPTFYLISTGGVDPFVNFDPSTYHRWNRSTREHEFTSDGNMTLRLGALAMNLGGAGFIRYKLVSGTLDGSGNVNGLDASPAHASLQLMGFITIADGSAPGRTSQVQVQMEGNNYYAVGGAGNAGKAYSGMIFYRHA